MLLQKLIFSSWKQLRFVKICDKFSQSDLDNGYTSPEVYEEGAMDRTVYLLTNSVLQSIYKENILPSAIIDQFK